MAATFVLYGGTAMIVTMGTRRLLPRILAWTVAAVLTPSVGLSRIYRGDHHPTDTIAGLALGLGALCVGALAVRAWAAHAAQTAPPGRAEHPETVEHRGPAEHPETADADTAGHSEPADDIAGVA